MPRSAEGTGTGTGGSGGRGRRAPSGAGRAGVPTAGPPACPKPWPAHRAAGLAPSPRPLHATPPCPAQHGPHAWQRLGMGSRHGIFSPHAGNRIPTPSPPSQARPAQEWQQQRWQNLPQSSHGESSLPGDPRPRDHTVPWKTHPGTPCGAPQQDLAEEGTPSSSTAHPPGSCCGAGRGHPVSFLQPSPRELTPAEP